MDFGKRMMTKARVRAFFAPRRSRVVNSGEEVGLRNPSFPRRRQGASRRPRIAGSAGAPRARSPRHDENDPVFDKIRQIHAFIPQIHAFFRQLGPLLKSSGMTSTRTLTIQLPVRLRLPPRRLRLPSIRKRAACLVLATLEAPLRRKALRFDG